MDCSNQENDFYYQTRSVCPTCLLAIDCRIAASGKSVYLFKSCPEHGDFKELIYSDKIAFEKGLASDKPGSRPNHYQGFVSSGCPDDCGLCPDHRQHTCVGIIEITDRCNLRCPVCYSGSRNSFELPFWRVEELIDLYIKCENNPEVLQISGGEPTLHPDIFRILKLASQKRIEYLLLNTNGIKLADFDFCQKIAMAMKSDSNSFAKPIVYLQFDGYSKDVSRALRGATLTEIKLEAIENCRACGLSVALVPTIVAGINEGEIGDILELALSDSNIKMINFQPHCRSGRSEIDHTQDRVTIPDITKEIERVSGGRLTQNNFMNVPCPHPTCSVSSYVYSSKDSTIELNSFIDSESFISKISNRASPILGLTKDVRTAADALFSMSAIVGSKKIDEALITLFGTAVPNIRKIIDNVTLISIHAFMDSFNFDIERAKKCCVTQILPNGKMIPFCVYNILYREKMKRGFSKIPKEAFVGD